ncbi:MarR family winged helix-turn-helix transcriptional regulator [Dactylosporangium sp. NPDC051485]|uniref:MarR family winged helix-turn-helix transcriptional regulator n=1 Tax=Dactylosporangium sp. NPDC051485 TaxID=3154846 RepID=UPI00341A9CE8
MDHVDALRDEVRELMKVLRLVKQHHQQGSGTLAPGVAGMLVAIDRLAGGCHLKELAADCALDQSTTSRAVSAFVADGLVRRVADPHDGRASFLELTDAGREAMCRTNELYANLLADALRDWTRTDVELFSGLLRRFVESVAAQSVPGRTTTDNRTTDGRKALEATP